MNAPFSTLTDEMLSDLGGYVRRLSAEVCPDLRARLRAEIADLPKPRTIIRWMIECNDAAGNCFATLPRLVAPWTDVNEEREEAQILAAYARKFDCPIEDLEWDWQTDIICRNGQAIGCLSTVPLR
jgi:hypothetical protein